MKRIVFTGVGGQSVRVISHVFAMALKEVGYEVALLFDYDSSEGQSMFVLPQRPSLGTIGDERKTVCRTRQTVN